MQNIKAEVCQVTKTTDAVSQDHSVKDVGGSRPDQGAIHNVHHSVVVRSPGKQMRKEDEQLRLWMISTRRQILGYYEKKEVPTMYKLLRSLKNPVYLTEAMVHYGQ